MSSRARLDWNTPAGVVAVKKNFDERSYIGGRWLEGVDFVIDEDTFNRIKQGRLCPPPPAGCLEPQERPFPDRCSLCGFPIKDKLHWWLDAFYEGEAKRGEHYGPSVDLNEEVDRLDAELEEDNWRADPTYGIIVPKTLDAS